MTIHVNTLPDLCLREIFARVPLCYLTQVGLVCSKWRWLQRSVGLKVRKLTILIGGEGPDAIQPSPQAAPILNEDDSLMFDRREYSSWDTIHLKYLDLNALIGLTVTFPNVTTLKVDLHLSSKYQLCAVTILLRLWQSKLVTFKLCATFDFGADVSDVYRMLRTLTLTKLSDTVSEPLLDAINALSGLKHLSLLFGWPSFHRSPLNLPILAQLDRFHFRSYDCTDVLFDSFRAYAVSNASLRLKYHLLAWTAEDYNQLGHQFSSQFEQISYDGNYLYRLTELDNFCAHFSSITILHLNMRDLIEFPIRKVFANLSRLIQLDHLRLFIEFKLERENDNDDGNIEKDQVEIALARLPSVKSLKLSVGCLTSHDNLSLLNIPWTMPNLEIVEVTIDEHDLGCVLCGYENEDVPDELVENCFSQVMMPLRACTRLRSISFETFLFDDYISLNNLTIDDLNRPLNFE